jgi:uncharacterized membrane protein YfhO
MPAITNADGNVDGESVVVTGQTDETLTMQATAVTDGLLVISAAYADDWNAYVDGDKVPVIRTDHALQGVALTAGSHTVEMRYEPKSLEIGLWSTGATSVAMIGIWAWAFVDRRRNADGPEKRPTTGDITA